MVRMEHQQRQEMKAEGDEYQPMNEAAHRRIVFPAVHHGLFALPTLEFHNSQDRT